jgi:hypothetical protein
VGRAASNVVGVRARRLLLVLTVVTTGLALVGCGDDDDGPTPGDDGEAAPWPGGSDETQAYDLGDGLVAELPAGWEVEPFADWEDGANVEPCSRRAASVSDGASYMRLELNSRGCAGIEQDSQIGNGYHGVYVGIDDVPEPQDVAEQDVAAGTLTTFSQEYFECTNSCSDFDDNVGLLALTSPPDPDFPTLVLLDEKGEHPIEDLVALADAIQPA